MPRSFFKITSAVLCILFFPATFPRLSAEDFSSADMAFQEGMKLEQAGRLIQAERQFKKALEFSPANPDYHFELANVYARMHDKSSSGESLRKAALELEQTVMIKPEHLAAHYNLGVVYKRRKMFEKAREQFKNVLQRDPNNVGAAMQIGASYEEQGFYDEAQDAYARAREMNPANPDVASALHDLEQHREQAREQMRQQTALSDMSRYTNRQNYSNNLLQQISTTDPSAAQQSGIAQAVPYLGALLVDQFMKRRSGRDDGDES